MPTVRGCHMSVSQRQPYCKVPATREVYTYRSNSAKAERSPTMYIGGGIVGLILLILLILWLTGNL
jgi:hypothetical protein